MEAPSEAGKIRDSRRRWVVLIATLAAAGAAALAAVQLRRAPAVPAQPPEKLSIAVSTTPHTALLHLAQAKGFFAEEGLDLSMQLVSHGKAALDLLAQGKADLAAAAEVPFVIAVLKGEPLGIAATVLSVSSEMAIVARRDRAISMPADLIGKRVGVTFGTSGDYYLWAFLTRNKLLPERVTMVDVPPGQIAEQLAGGSIDAATVWEPLRSKAQAALGTQAVAFNESNAYTVTHVVIGRNNFLKQRAGAIEKFVRAVVKAEQFNRIHPHEAQALVAPVLKLDAAALQSSWRELDFTVNLRQSHLIALEDQARWAITRGYAPRQPVPNFLPHLYLDALLSVSPERVTVVH